MAEQIKELIEKIQQEGINAAEEKAKEIRKEAALKAAEIVDKASVEAHRIISSAKEEAEKLQINTNTLLAQSARDMILSLKKEITAMLDAIIARELRQALTTDELEKIIHLLGNDGAMVIGEHFHSRHGFFYSLQIGFGCVIEAPIIGE